MWRLVPASDAGTPEVLAERVPLTADAEHLENVVGGKAVLARTARELQLMASMVADTEIQRIVREIDVKKYSAFLLMTIPAVQLVEKARIEDRGQLSSEKRVHTELVVQAADMRRKTGSILIVPKVGTPPDTLTIDRRATMPIMRPR